MDSIFILLFKLELVLSFYFDELHFEDECRVSGNLGWGTWGTVAKVGGDDQFALLALAHSEQSLIPSLDNLSRSQCEGEWISAWNARIELSTILEGALREKGKKKI